MIIIIPKDEVGEGGKMDLAKMMPLAQHLGIEISEAKPDQVVGQLLVRPELCTAGQIAHGGTIMALADCVSAIGAYLALPSGAQMTTTIESKTNFLGSAAENSLLIAEATPLKIGKRLSVWQCQIRTESGADVALIIQTQLVLWPA